MRGIHHAHPSSVTFGESSSTEELLFEFSLKLLIYTYFSIFSTSARVSSRSFETPSSCMVTP